MVGCDAITMVRVQMFLMIDVNTMVECLFALTLKVRTLYVCIAMGENITNSFLFNIKRLVKNTNILPSIA